MKYLIITYILSLLTRIGLYFLEKKNKQAFASDDTIHSAVEIVGQDQRLFGLRRGWYVVRLLFSIVVLYVLFEVFAETGLYLGALVLGSVVFVVLVDIAAQNRQFMYDWKIMSGIVSLSLPVLWITFTILFATDIAKQGILALGGAETLAYLATSPTIGTAFSWIAALILLGFVLFDMWWLFEHTRPYAMFRFKIAFNKDRFILQKQFGDGSIAEINFSQPYQYEKVYIWERLYIGSKVSIMVRKKVHLFEQNGVYLGIIVFADSRFPEKGTKHYSESELYTNSKYGFIVTSFSRRHFLKFDEELKEKVLARAIK